MSDYEYAVISGRFSPVTPGELALIDVALEQADRVIIVIEGRDIAPSVQMPWTVSEREALIRAGLTETGRIVFAAVRDHRYRPDETISALMSVVESKAGADAKIVKIGGSEVDGWHYSPAPDFAADAEEMRGAYLREGAGVFAGEVPDATATLLETYAATPGYTSLVEEQAYVDKYRASWAVAPYSVTMASVDVVIVAGDRLLLIRRGGVPGKGQWALPGGFVDAEEPLIDAALRELQEETGLDLAETEFELVAREVFDDPKRSSRGRIITHAFVFRIDSDPPAVEGGDDADAARWVPLAEVADMRGTFFEDHGAMLDHFGLFPLD